VCLATDTEVSGSRLNRVFRGPRFPCGDFVRKAGELISKSETWCLRQVDSEVQEKCPNQLTIPSMHNFPHTSTLFLERYNSEQILGITQCHLDVRIESVSRNRGKHRGPIFPTQPGTLHPLTGTVICTVLISAYTQLPFTLMSVCKASGIKAARSTRSKTMQYTNGERNGITPRPV